MMEGVVELVLGHVHRALEAGTFSAAKRQLRRTQAHAAVLRLVCEWDGDAIIEALDHGEPLTKARVYKWVERGRAPVREGLDRWAATADGEEIVLIEVLRELIDARRADAGRPRPERRRSSGGDPQ